MWINFYFLIPFLCQDFLPYLPLHVRVPRVIRSCSECCAFVLHALHLRVTVSLMGNLCLNNINFKKNVSMPIKFDLYNNPENEGVTSSGIHAKVITRGVINTRNISQSINRKCTLTESDVWAVLTALRDELYDAFKDGYSVHLEGLGHFSLSLKCDPNVSPKYVSSNDISVKGIRFVPEKELLDKLECVHFEHDIDDSRHSKNMEQPEIIVALDKYFADNQFLRRIDFEKLTGFNKSKALRTLKELVKDGVLKNVGTVNMPMYIKNER